MKKIEAYIGYDERTNERRSFIFDIKDKPPELGEVIYGDLDEWEENPREGYRERICEVNELKPLSEQESEEVFNYDYYVCLIQMEVYVGLLEEWEHNIFDSNFYAVKKENTT